MADGLLKALAASTDRKSMNDYGPSLQLEHCKDERLPFSGTSVVLLCINTVIISDNHDKIYDIYCSIDIDRLSIDLFQHCAGS